MTAYTDTSYRKINYTSGRSEWGAWIGTGYGRNAVAKPATGDAVQIRTKAGEIHTRTIARIVEDYKSGVLVSLVPDEQVAANAKTRYDAKAAESQAQRPERGINHARLYANGQVCPLCHSYCYGDCEANR